MAATIESNLGLSFSPKVSEISFQTTVPLTDFFKLAVLGGLDLMNENDSYLTVEGTAKTWIGVLAARSAYMGSLIRTREASFGLEFDMGATQLTMGASNSGSEWYPYLRMLYNVGGSRPYVVFSKQVELGFQYVFSGTEKVLTEQVHSSFPKKEINTSALSVKKLLPSHPSIPAQKKEQNFSSKLGVLKAALDLGRLDAPKKKALSDLHISSVFTDQRVTQSPFHLKAQGPAGMVVTINGRKWMVDRTGEFRVPIPLVPGTNKVQLGVEGETKECSLVYLKRYTDLSKNDYFTPLLEKISMLGFWQMSDRFEPTRPVTKGDLMNALVKAGYRTKEDLSDKGASMESLTYDEAIKLIRDLTEVSIQTSTTHQGVLTRRVAALLLYELPKIKTLIHRYYPEG